MRPAAVALSKSIAIIAIVATAAVVLAAASYQYSADITSDIARVAASDIQSNAKIQAHDISRVLVAKVDAINNNLRGMSGNPVFNDAEIIDTGKQVLSRAQNDTGDLTDFYMWLDKDGKIVWLSNIDEETYEEVKGTDLSYRTYFFMPRDTQSIYYSTAILSNDNIARMYLAAPIMQDGEFSGVVAAAVRLEVLGKYLKSQLAPDFENNIGMMDRKGIILYTSNATFIGKDAFGDEFQSLLPEDLKTDFNSFLRRSLAGGEGTEDITFRGQTGTLAYQTVAIDDQDFGVIYVTQQHNFASDVLALIDQQRNFSTALIISIGAIAIGIAVVVLLWNSRLERKVRSKTTELEKAVVSLKSANEQLKDRDKMQQEFINIAAHELRTPIQPIIGMIELLGADRPEPGRDEEEVAVKRRDLRLIGRNAERLNRLSSDILDATRIEGKALKLQSEQVDLAGLAAEAIEDAKKRANGNNGKVDIELVRPAEGWVVVEGDRGRIEQVVSNLINNAIRFTKSGAVTVTVSKKDGHVEVAVSDTGRGIDQEMMPRLFTKFSSNAEIGGTGLGLYISKSIVEAHGGRIWAENNAQGGATFTFSLPANGKANGPEGPA
ncbi:MAG: sensor histidine kinase [Nitrososphaera sp.]